MSERNGYVPRMLPTSRVNKIVIVNWKFTQKNGVGTIVIQAKKN